MTGMVRQPRVENLFDPRVPVEVAGDRQGVGAMLAHAHRQRLRPAQDEPAVEGRRNGAQ